MNKEEFVDTTVDILKDCNITIEQSKAIAELSLILEKLNL